MALIWLFILRNEDKLRSFTTATTAHALGIDRKALDNFLARDGLHLDGTGRRGRSRRISSADIEELAIAFILHRDLGIALGRAAAFARSISGSNTGEIAVGSLGRLLVDLPRLRALLEAALAIALEEVAPVPRGRPRSIPHSETLPDTKRGAS